MLLIAFFFLKKKKMTLLLVLFCYSIFFQKMRFIIFHVKMV
jgi:hypothetical protein